MDNSCTVYLDPSASSFLLGFTLAIGIFISYIPQYSKVISRRSTEGLSPLFLFLGSASGFSSLINLIIVTIPARSCCRSELTGFQCVNSQLGLAQVGLQALGYTLILIFCVYLTGNSMRESPDEYARIYTCYKVFLWYALVNGLLAVFFVFFRDFDSAFEFATFSGLLSTALATAQYLPQIYTTFRLKHPGSLSIYMMILQTPGGYLWSLSLYLQPGSTWSSWLPYFTAAALQMILLIMCLYYEWTLPTVRQEEEAIERIVENNITDETSPLLTETP